MKQLSFKEYLDSKNKLLEAIKKTPIQTIEYAINKYCKLVVGEKDNKVYIPLKPSQKIVVEWQYADPFSDPTPISLCFHDVKDVDSTDQFTTFWHGARLKTWLIKNSIEQ